MISHHIHIYIHITSHSQTMLIKFYQESETPYGIFSNYYNCNTVYTDLYQNKIEFKTIEHMYQYLKFTKFTPINSEYRELIKNASSPNIAKLYGDLNVPAYLLKYSWAQSVAKQIEYYKELDVEYNENVEPGKAQIMYCLLKFKYGQNKQFRDVLQSTGTNDIGLDSHHDYYWGLGKDGSGKNMLGKLLVKLREEMKNK